MDELISKYLANNLKDFAGLEVTGSVPVKQEVINEFIKAALVSGTEAVPSSPAAPADKRTSEEFKVNPREFLKFVKKAEVTAEDGKLTLSFALRIDP
jgi:hypothetical protein